MQNLENKIVCGKIFCMIKLYLLGLLVLVLGLVFQILNKSKKLGNLAGKTQYNYKRKEFIITRAEHECFDALMTAIGNDYFVFPQIHLSSILDHKIAGQYWKASFGHINQKSVDFILCDKKYLSPKLAIELDDISHKAVKRIWRDTEVERIFKDVELPLLRLENHGSFNSKELAEKIRLTLSVKTNSL